MDESDEEQVKKVTSDMYFTSINVEATLHQLQELACQSAEEKEEDSQNEYREITDNISELSRQRNELHDLLEIETINANKRRRALLILPKTFNAQMQDAVVAARTQNSDKIMSLQKKLNSLKDEVGSVKKKMEELNAENITMKPDCDIIRKEHDQIIAQLNHRMSVKSSKQIVLNETCDSLREVQRQTAEIDLGLEDLAEDLEHDKNEAAATKSELLKEIAETESHLADSKEKIDEQKKILNSLMEQNTEKSVETEERRKIIGRLENSVIRLEMDAMQLDAKIDREKRANQDTKSEIEKIIDDTSKDSIVFQEKIDAIQKKVNQSYVERSAAEGEHEECQRLKNDATRNLAESKERKVSFLKQVKDSAKEFERLKELISLRVEETGKITLMNTAVEEKLKELDENHRATVDLYQSQSDDLTGHLNKEKGDRMKVQLQREESEKHLDSFRSEENMFLTNITTKIRSASGEHQKLTEKSLYLARTTEKNKRNIDTLEVKLEVAQSEYRKMKSSLQQDLERLKKSVESLKEDVAKKRVIKDEKGPLLEELIQRHEALNKEYNEDKDEMMAIRNQEKSLTEQKNRTSLMLNKIRKVINELKFKLEQAHTKTLDQLKQENKERDEAEEKMNQIINQVEIIFKSNKHFDESKAKLEVDFQFLLKGMGNYAAHQNMLLKQFRAIQEQFAGSWAVTLGMERESADHDAKLLTDIQRIQKDTQERARTLSKIAEEMEEDLSILTAFTDNVTSRRPKDTRQSKRGSRRGLRDHSTHKREPQLVRVVSIRRPHSSHVAQRSAYSGLTEAASTESVQNRTPLRSHHQDKVRSTRSKSAKHRTLVVETPAITDSTVTQTHVKSLHAV